MRRPKSVRLSDYTPPPFLLDDVALTLELGERDTRVRAQLDVRRNPLVANQEAELSLDGEALELLSLHINGRPLHAGEYALEEGSLRILEPPAQGVVQLETRIDPGANTGLQGLYRSGGLLCTQCEPHGFRRITYFPDRPDVMAKYTTTLIADAARYPVLLSNGNRIDSGMLPDGRHWATWHDPHRKPCYLFALVAGDLARDEGRHVTRSGRQVVLQLYVEPGSRGRTSHAMAALRRAMAWEEECFGCEYDLNVYMIVAVDDFNMGAMENKGLNIFNSKFLLAHPTGATDEDLIDIEAVVGHEYFHNWTGNRVTLRDWFQLSLKEGLTVYREAEFIGERYSRVLRRIEDVRSLRSRQFAEDDSPMAHPVRPQSYMEVNNFYTATVYEKGAELVRMLATLLGRAGFRRGLALYLQRHDGDAVTIEALLAAMADANAVDLQQFQRWYDQAGTPRVSVIMDYEPATRTCSLTVSQSTPATAGQPDKEPLLIPLAVGLLDPGGHDLPLQLQGESAPAGTTRVLPITRARQTFTFVNCPQRPVPSLLRDFSAPVRLEHPYRDRDLAFLMARDSDPFNRWDASQQLTIKVMRRLLAALQGAQALALDQGLASAFRHLLADREADPALVAEMLTLPSEGYVGELLEEVDVDGIHGVREFLRQALGSQLERQLLGVYQRLRDARPWPPDGTGMAQRRLQNLCLAYLMAPDTPDARSLAMRQFEAADHMSDTIGALRALADSRGPEREQAMQRFHDRWQGDDLVLEKWLSLEATADQPDVITRVRELLVHPAFDRSNPNKVRALLGAFAGGNPIHFHDPSGAGYRLLAEQTRDLDPINPQMAAYLARSLSRWRRLDRHRSELMRGEIDGLAGLSGLSGELSEVLAKSLEDA